MSKYKVTWATSPMDESQNETLHEKTLKTLQAARGLEDRLYMKPDLAWVEIEKIAE